MQRLPFSMVTGGSAFNSANSLMSKGWVGNLMSTGVTTLGGVVKQGGGRKVGAGAPVSSLFFLTGGDISSFELLRRFLSGLGLEVVVEGLAEELDK